jgi:IS5 family transposase
MTDEKHVQRNLIETLLPLGSLELDPELKAVDRILDEDPTILQSIIDILNHRHRYSKTLGRRSTPAEVVLRVIILKHIYSWRFRETTKRVNESLALRYFTRIYFDRVPHYSVVARYEQLIPEELLKAINTQIVKIARKRKVTKGIKLRVDTTVVESDIHYPTDSSLLYDSVRVISRIARQCKKAGIATGQITRDFRRSAKRQVLNIVKYARGRSEQAQDTFKECYRTLLSITTKTLRNAVHLKEIIAHSASHMEGEAKSIAKRATAQLDRYLPLIERVIEQTRRRVLRTESVPSAEKLLSIFQPDSYVIRKGKPHKPTEFGKVVKIQEADGKIITDFDVYDTNLSDTQLFVPSIEKHIEVFLRPPNLAAADRGFYSQENQRQAHTLGVQHVSVPKRGKKSQQRRAYEKQRWFRAGQRFRSGSEGKISVLKRTRGLSRCLNKVDNAFERWIGWAVIASNLITIANL